MLQGLAVSCSVAMPDFIIIWTNRDACYSRCKLSVMLFTVYTVNNDATGPGSFFSSGYCLYRVPWVLYVFAGFPPGSRVFKTTPVSGLDTNKALRCE